MPMQKPSFMTGIFAGEPDFTLISPFPMQSEEDRTIGDAFCVQVESFLEQQLDALAVERDAKIPQAVIDGLFSLGAFGMKIPKEYEGLGLSQTNYNRVLTLVASKCNILALTLSAHQSIGVSMPILLYGSEAQKKAYLPRVARKELSAFALTEPSVGSDPASMKIEAVLNSEGTHFVVTGEKLWITNSAVAKILVLMARVPCHLDLNADGKATYVPVPGGQNAAANVITSFIVEMDTPGIEIAQRCEFEGCRGIENAHLRFHGVKIPVANVIGEVGKGLQYALSILNIGRVSVDAICLGIGKQVWKPTLAWANKRFTFGKTIGHHELQTMRIARMAADLFAAEASTFLAAQLIDRKECDIRIESALTKVFVSEASIRLVRDTQLLFGGRGYETADSKAKRGEWAFPAEQLVRDAELYRIGEGATDILTPFFAREALDMHLKRAQDFINTNGLARLSAFFGLAKFYVPWYLGKLFPTKNTIHQMAHPRVRIHLSYVDKSSRRLARNVLYMMMVNLYAFLRGRVTLKQLRDHQGVIARIANASMDLFVITATTLYAEQQETGQQHGNAWDLADQVLRDAKKRLEGDGYFTGMKWNDDAATVKVGLSALQGQYDWLAEGAIARHYE